MLGDTIVLPQAGGDITCKKINQDGYSSEYLFRDTTSQYRVRIRHTKTNKTTARPVEYDRHNFEVVQTVFAAGDVAEYERKFYFVHEHKPGDTSVALADAVADKVILSSNALLVALLGWES
jgi:aminoglycoside phosphotransferase (APT) family kinase protein